MHVISPIVDKKGNPVKTDVSINCRTQNIIYGIYCADCENLVYVGETRNMLVGLVFWVFARCRLGLACESPAG